MDNKVNTTILAINEYDAADAADTIGRRSGSPPRWEWKQVRRGGVLDGLYRSLSGRAFIEGDILAVTERAQCLMDYAPIDWLRTLIRGGKLVLMGQNPVPEHEFIDPLIPEGFVDDTTMSAQFRTHARASEAPKLFRYEGVDPEKGQIHVSCPDCFALSRLPLEKACEEVSCQTCPLSARIEHNYDGKAAYDAWSQTQSIVDPPAPRDRYWVPPVEMILRDVDFAVIENPDAGLLGGRKIEFDMDLAAAKHFRSTELTFRADVFNPDAFVEDLRFTLVGYQIYASPLPSVRIEMRCPFCDSATFFEGQGIEEIRRMGRVQCLTCGRSGTPERGFYDQLPTLGGRDQSVQLVDPAGHDPRTCPQCLYLGRGIGLGVSW